jgi:hypothetical protein
MNGLSDGSYAVNVVTNRYDEVIVELAATVVAGPAVISELRRLN